MTVLSLHRLGRALHVENLGFKVGVSGLGFVLLCRGKLGTKPCPMLLNVAFLAGVCLSGHKKAFCLPSACFSRFQACQGQG